MNKIMFAGLVSSLAILGGCSTTQMSDNDPGIMERPVDMVGQNDKPYTDVNIPTWFLEAPKDTSEDIYGAGSGLSSDLQFSIDKAMHQAKIVLADKLKNTVSAEFKTYIADNSEIGGMTIEESQRISKSGFKDVDVSEYEVVNKAIYKDVDEFRTYVLLTLKRKLQEEMDRVNKEQNVTTPVDIEKIESTRDTARQALDSL